MFKTLKKLLTLAAPLLLTAPLAAADLTAAVIPPVVNLGQHFELVLESHDGSIRLLEGIRGARVVEVRQFSNIVNGESTHSARYTCLPLDVGTLEIPPLNVSVGGEAAKTQPLTVVVNRSLTDELREPKPKPKAEKSAEPPEKAQGSKALALELAKAGEVAFGIGAFPNERRNFYVGEVVPMELRLYLKQGVDVRMDYPTIDVGKALITDFSHINRHNPDFAPPEKYAENPGNAPYSVVVFPTSFRPMAVGVLQASARQTFTYRRADSLRSAEATVAYHIPEITIRQLPPAPPGVLYTGLSGNWTIMVAQNREEAEAGETIELTVTVSGEGALEGLKPPEISIPNCRIYPPELKTYHGYNYACLTYLVIPTKAGNIEQPLRLATFSPTAGEYRECDFTFRAKVTGSAEVGTPFAPPLELEDLDDEPAGSELRHQLKLHPATPVKLPLWRNHLALSITLLAAGPVLLALASIAGVSRRASKGEVPRRHRRAISRRGKVLRELAKASSRDLPEVVNSQVAPFLNDAFGYPPGSDASAIADLTTDRELAELMRAAAAAGYLPENERKLADSENFRKALLKTLKRLTAITVAASAALTAVHAGTAEPDAWKNACELLVVSDNERAMHAFDALRDPAAPDPAADFNLGAAAFGAGNYPLALWAFEQAHLLRPRDAEITDSLNVLRRRFFLPEAGDTSTTPRMLAALRDAFRPDEYLLAAAFMVFAAFVVVLLRRKMSKHQCVAGSAACALAAATLAAVAAWQYAGNYSPTRAIVVAPEAALRAMPSETGKESATTLRGGSCVEILSPALNGYTQVRSGKRSGFLRDDELRALLP